MSLNYSKLRKELQRIGEAPSWYTTAGLQLFYEKYSYNNETPLQRYKTLAYTMAKHAPHVYPDWWEKDTYTKGKTWADAFFFALWDGYISPSTPMLANGGLRKRGTTVSCSGGYVGDNLFERYDAITEAAILTKHSHGVSYSIDHWPSEGTPLKRGGHSLGVLPIIRDFMTTMNEVTQGSRRGSLAYSLDIEHGDFDKVVENLYKHPESNNVGWLIKDGFVKKLNDGDKEAISKFNKSLGVKLPRGKGYYTFKDKCQRHLAEAFKRAGLQFEASNLCQECCLPANKDYTYSCVILNYNLEVYRQWPEHIVHIGQIMSDCNVTEYLQTIDEMTEYDRRAMSKIYRFTNEFRALGSGVLAWHTLLQQEMIPVDSLEAMYLNNEVFTRLGKDSIETTKWLAEVLGEPIGCKGLGIRNATRLMMPPTKSTAELSGGQSEGVGYDVAMAFTKQSAGGEFFRINKVLLNIMKERGVYNDEEIKKITKEKTVKNVSWLSDFEKRVFRTAFEIPAEWILRLASQRQRIKIDGVSAIDQAQSINLYFTSNDSEEYIGEIHKQAFNDEGILTLYYVYSMRGAEFVKREDVCETCVG